MRILTLIRQVLDAQETVRIVDRAVDLEGRKLVMDTMDEYGVEEALRLRERGAHAEIVAVAVGPARTQEALRSALAMGADRAILVETDLILDPIALSAVVARIAQEEDAQLILCGGQQADWDSQALGSATAERLQWSLAAWTRSLKLAGVLLSGERDTDEGVESFDMPLPAVVTTQQGLNEPRYPTLPNIMKSKKKEIRIVSLDACGIHPKLRHHGVEVHARERLRKILDGRDASLAAAQLVHTLRLEAGVIA
jgi:electron transfer flavoprotein beta subunit